LAHPNQNKNRKWLEQLRAEGKAVPSLDNEPVLFERSKWLWRAWLVLNARRVRTDSGPQPVPMSEMLSYVQYEDITEEWRREALLETMGALDGLYMEHTAQQREKAAREANKGSGKRKRR
jgi:hypothetical protein